MAQPSGAELRLEESNATDKKVNEAKENDSQRKQNTMSGNGTEANLNVAPKATDDLVVGSQTNEIGNGHLLAQEIGDETKFMSPSWHQTSSAAGDAASHSVKGNVSSSETKETKETKEQNVSKEASNSDDINRKSRRVYSKSDKDIPTPVIPLTRMPFPPSSSTKIAPNLSPKLPPPPPKNSKNVTWHGDKKSSDSESAQKSTTPPKVEKEKKSSKSTQREWSIFPRGLLTTLREKTLGYNPKDKEKETEKQRTGSVSTKGNNLSQSQLQKRQHHKNQSPEGADIQTEVIPSELLVPLRVADTKVWQVPLEIAALRTDPNGVVPTPISKAIAFVEAYGLDTEGLYRVPGKQANVNKIRQIFDSGQGEWFQFTEGAIRDATSTLVNFLNNLPEPLYTNQFAKEIHAAAEKGDVVQIREIIKRLPLCNQETLRVLCEHFATVSAHANENKMTVDNIAKSMGPDYSSILPTLINNCKNLFASPIVFGVSLEESARKSRQEVPEVLLSAFAFIETCPMKKQYVYFQSGDLEKIQRYKIQFNSGEVVKFDPQDLHTVTGVVKKFLSDLPESLFTKELEHQFEAIQSLREADKLSVLQGLFSRLPLINIKVLKMFCDHFIVLAKYHDTFMTVASLCETLGKPYAKGLPPLIFHYDHLFNKPEYTVENWDVCKLGN